MEGLRPLTSVQTKMLAAGAAMMVVGVIGVMFGALISIVLVKVATIVFAVGAVVFAVMQLMQTYDGRDITVRRLRSILNICDLCFILSALLMIESNFHIVYPLVAGTVEGRNAWIHYVYNNWVVTLLIAAILEMYVTHRLSKVLQTPLIVLIVIAFSLTGCRHRSQVGSDNQSDSQNIIEPLVEIKGDSMIYGLACDGSSDSVIVLWPFDGEPITYSCIDAKNNGHVIGKPQIGDWVGVMINPNDTTEVTMVINLDQLKGTWTYPVMPVMKDLQNMSPRMQRRMMADMPDSVKQTYFIPREYGFTLKRSSQAQAVGRIMRSNTLEDDSPVQYPELKNYREWHTYNGKLILVSGDFINLANEEDKAKKPKVVIDTLDFVYMDNDSLILMRNNEYLHFHRKENAMKANAAATRAQQKQDEKNNLK